MENELQVLDAKNPMVQNLSGVEAWANALTIRTPDERTEAYAELQGIKRTRKWFVDFFADSKAKAHSAWKAVVANETTFTDRCDNAETVAKKKILAFDAEQERVRIAEQRKLQAEADARAAAERARLEKEAAKLKTPELREARLEQAAAVSAPVIELAPVTQKQNGESTRKLWKMRIVDANLVPREWLIINESALNAFARSTKGAVAVPGVEFYGENSLAISTK